MRRHNQLYYKNATLLKNALSFFGQWVLQTSEIVNFCERVNELAYQVFRPLGRTLGLKSTRKRYPDTNDILEKAYKSKIAGKKSASQQEEILRLSHELQMPERKIERWLRQRAMAGKPSQLDKFSETGWRWVYYTGIFIWGVKCLWSKKWLWTIKVIFLKFWSYSCSIA